ncbi:MAG: serine/threonine protein kinase [Myxococcaceae bacterium]|nr:MAG: serine/threonine protein kinase [Myxococcaceae bacterium]
MARDTLAPGEVVAERYAVEALLARGGMATVYRVRHVATGATGALKLLLADALVEPALRKKFVQEAQVGARIESEHVVRVTDAGVEADGTPWLVMELLDGETLDAYLARCGPLDRSEALTLLRQVAHGLGAAHRAFVVHRDLKPANVFIARARRADVRATVKLLDFGIASVLSAARTGAGPTLVGGTPGWMAPEQAVPGMAVSPASDVWAFGLLAFEMLVGRSYFDEHTLVGTTLPTASARATALGRSGRLPRDVDAWFARCVAIDPSRRFADVESAFAALEPALGAPVRQTSPKRSRRIFAVAAVAVAAVAGLLAFASSSPAVRPPEAPTPAVLPAPSVPPSPSPWFPQRPTSVSPAPLTSHPVLSTWLATWAERVRRADDLRDDDWAALYTDPVDHGGRMPRERLSWHWRQRVMLGRTQGAFEYYAFESKWWVDTDATSPGACRIAADGPELLVLRLAAHNGGDEDAVRVGCSPMEGTYEIRARVVGGALRICAEAWSDCAAVCARCPQANRWRCCPR